MATKSSGVRESRPLRAAALVIGAAAVLSALTVLGLRWAASPKPVSSGQASAGLGFTRLDRAAPALTLPSLAGHGSITLTKLSGKPIVLNFWASTCTVCRQETPAMASVAKSLGGRVTFLGVDSVDQRSPAIAFEDRYGVPYPSVFDPQGTAAIKYDVPALPVTFFLSPTGKKILGENIGALTASRLRVILRELYGTV